MEKANILKIELLNVESKRLEETNEGLKLLLDRMRSEPIPRVRPRARKVKMPWMRKQTKNQVGQQSLLLKTVLSDFAYRY